MLNLTINVENAAANATLRAITLGLKERAGMHASIATAVETEVRSHLVKHYTHRNRRVRHCDPDEVHAITGRLEHQAKRMGDRAREIRAAFHRAVC